jgi:hypothetical protein
MAGVLYTFYVLYKTFVLHATVPGWTSLVCLQVIFSGAILVAIGLVGDYVARIYEEAKGRPLYVLNDAINVARRREDPERTIICRAGERGPEGNPANRGLRCADKGEGLAEKGEGSPPSPDN